MRGKIEWEWNGQQCPFYNLYDSSVFSQYSSLIIGFTDDTKENWKIDEIITTLERNVLYANKLDDTTVFFSPSFTTRSGSSFERHGLSIGDNWTGLHLKQQILQILVPFYLFPSIYPSPYIYSLLTFDCTLTWGSPSLNKHKTKNRKKENSLPTTMWASVYSIIYQYIDWVLFKWFP